MAINGGTILSGATCAFTGGTSVTLLPTGKTVPNGISVADFSVLSILTRPRFEFRTVEAKLLSDGYYGKGSRQLVGTFPKVLASGKQGFPCIRFKLEDFPEMTPTEVDVMRLYTAQLIMDTDFDQFWRQGAVR